MKKNIVKLPFSEKQIIDAIGDRLGFSSSKKERFAQNIIKDLQNVFATHKTSIPSKQKIDQFINELDNLNKTIEKLVVQSKESLFVNAILSVSSRAISSQKYNIIDLQDILALSEVASMFTKHERFQNNKSGPDSRLSVQIALVIATQYRISFASFPGITGAGKRDDNKFKDTPFQRVCDLVAESMKIKIGRSSQEMALKILKGEQALKPYFSPDVSNLSEKK